MDENPLVYNGFGLREKIGNYMAKSIIICSKNEIKRDLSKYTSYVRNSIEPENINCLKPYVYEEKKLYTCVVNPTSTVKTNMAGCCLGVVDDDREQLWEPNSNIPDGTFTLFRHDNNYVEVVSDYTATRTIWYVFSDEYFVASTSQRMIISFLGDFQLNNKAVRWMLSAGILGPENSWDVRINSLPGNSSIVLDRSTWTIEKNIYTGHQIKPINKSREWHKSNYENALNESLTLPGIDYSKWTLALSGGLDSRSIIYKLKDNDDKHSITWGVDGAQKEKNTDAYIANMIAKKCSYNHEYMSTNTESSDFVTTLNRFLIAGEGRVDHLSAYMDGLNLWSILHKSGRGIIRGYDAQGASTRVVTNERQARIASTMILSSDYKGMFIPENLRVTEKDIPESLKKGSQETLEEWRDRLWLSFRTPVVTAALDEIKVAYVEIFNPLLFRKIVKAIKLLPDSYRNNKNLFRDMVKKMFPEIPYAKRDSIEELESILNNDQIKAVLRSELLTRLDSNILPDEFVKAVADGIEKSSQRRSVLRILKKYYRSYVPMPVRNVIHKSVSYIPLDNRRIALRVLIVLRMHELLSNDAELEN